MTTKPTLGADKVDNDIPTATDWNRDIVQEGNWAQEVLAGTNADKIAAAAISGTLGTFPNALINGGWEVWQRGTGPYTANNVVTADRWKTSVVGSSTYSLSRVAAVVGGSAFAGQVVYTHVGGGSMAFFQDLENFSEYRGKTMSLSAQVVSNVNNGLFIQIADNNGGQSSARYSGGGAAQTLSCTYTVTTNATILRILFLLDTATQTAYLDNAMFAVIPTAPVYMPRNPAEETLLCRRYYQTFQMGTQWRTGSANETQEIGVYFPTPMSAPPTATLTAGTRTNVVSGTTSDIDTGGLRLIYTASASANVQAIANNDVLTLDTGI